jgi:hypothetical protein
MHAALALEFRLADLASWSCWLIWGSHLWPDTRLTNPALFGDASSPMHSSLESSRTVPPVDWGTGIVLYPTKSATCDSCCGMEGRVETADKKLGLPVAVQHLPRMQARIALCMLRKKGRFDLICAISLCRRTILRTSRLGCIHAVRKPDPGRKKRMGQGLSDWSLSLSAVVLLYTKRKRMLLPSLVRYASSPVLIFASIFFSVFSMRSD